MLIFPALHWVATSIISWHYGHLSVLNMYLPIDSLSEGGSMPGSLTKADIISLIQTENGYSRRKSTDIVETLLEIIKRALESSDDVLISGFGKFQVRQKKATRAESGNRWGYDTWTEEGGYVQVCWEVKRSDKCGINAFWATSDYVSLCYLEHFEIPVDFY